MSAGLPNPQMEPPQRGWFGRNWKWVIPVGCVLPLILCCGGGTAAFMFGLGALKNLDVYKEAVTKAKANPEVKAALGDPIKEGFVPTGTFDMDPAKGHADLNIGLSGPNGSGTLFAVAHVTDGKWVFTKLDFIVASTGATIDVIGSERKATEPKKK